MQCGSFKRSSQEKEAKESILHLIVVSQIK